MRTKKTFAPQIISENRIKLRIDHRTIITVRTKAAMQMWMDKYPDATVID